MLETIIITDEEMAALPLGTAGFLAFVNLCREKLAAIEARYSDRDDPIDARISFLTNVINAGHHYEVPGFQNMSFDPSDDFGYQDARRVARLLEGEISKLRFVALKERRGVAVVDEPARLKVEHLISQLRERVKEADTLSDRQKTKLGKKIDELAALFAGGSKPNIQATMVVIASIFTAINQAEAAIIKLPEVISAVLEVFGHAQEDADEKLLEAKVQQLRIEHQKSAEVDKPDNLPKHQTYDINDDIPF